MVAAVIYSVTMVLWKGAALRGTPKQPLLLRHAMCNDSSARCCYIWSESERAQNASVADGVNGAWTMRTPLLIRPGDDTLVPCGKKYLAHNTRIHLAIWTAFVRANPCTKLRSRVVSVPDSGAEGPGFKS